MILFDSLYQRKGESMKKVLFFLLILGTSLLQAKMFQSVPEDKATLVQSGKDARYCSMCGMDLVKFYKTSHVANVDGKPTQFCSIHCLFDAINSGKKVTDIKVVDTKSLKLIDAKKAYYVVGSDVKGTMSHVSKYAFATMQDAKMFAQKHGGKIMNFEEALQEAKKDFEHPMMMHHKKHMK